MKNQTKVVTEKCVQELFITREFEAPRELVFKAFNDPKLLVQWLGVCDMTMRIDHLDSRTASSYRFVNCTATGQEFSFNGVIHDVTAPERIIRPYEFEGLPERRHASLETATFEALPGNRRKLIISESRYPI